MKMENHKRRFPTCADEDRINNLSEHLIDSILERLPFQDVVRTSILSKKWRYRWTRMRVLVLDKQFCQKIAKNGAYGRNGFIRIINQVLILHKGPISKFSLHIPKMYLYSFEEIDELMLCLSKNSVRELVLTNSNRRYELPSYVFSCIELRKLELENCIFKPPLEFKGFFNVVNLFLKDIDFGANSWETPFSLPHLKRLCLHTCTNVYNFNIKAKKLKTLIVITCPQANVLRLLDSPCLTVIALSFQKPIKDFVRVERVNLTILLSKLPKIEQFYIDGHFSKPQLHDDVGASSNHLEAPGCLDQTLKRLQLADISLEGSRPELLFIKLVLAHSPSLKKFFIRPSGPHDAQKWFNIAKDTMQFPRASPNAETVYLNPKP
ncbi:F-box domain, cyclin-like protein [Cynara cardunculus var. scolymus]|uniref:F-box domain, cyclin-like protein n=1 Tax=Cynara cardunculus var. scolymus TaxID=59895 RepID=A0A103Y113_CYNCS|nr:F-box domain, cyclin-like protein [Cynara cardunculus var. scolymus]